MDAYTMKMLIEIHQATLDTNAKITAIYDSLVEASKIEDKEIKK